MSSEEAVALLEGALGFPPAESPGEEALRRRVLQALQPPHYLLGGGHYRPVTVGAEGVYHSRALPGFRLQVEWLWQEPLPQVLQVARELGLI